MCATCGCSGDTRDHHHVSPDHHHDHHNHHHDHSARSHVDRSQEVRHSGLREDDVRSRTLRLEQDVLAENEAAAAQNRKWFEERSIIATNFLSSPGSGKTTLLERLIDQCRQREIVVSVLQGDQATERDADRVRAAGARAIQINTGTGCHLDARMVQRALDELAPPPSSVVFIENVGNLVCPALFGLGEHRRIVVASVTEGEDKPLKYPYMFRRADLIVINKRDLMPHVDFEEEAFLYNVRSVNPDACISSTSAKTGEGVRELLPWVTPQSLVEPEKIR